MSAIAEAVSRHFGDNTVEAVISNAVGASAEYRKIVIRKFGGGYQAEKFTDTQAFHQNLTVAEAVVFIASVLGSTHRQYNAWDAACEHEIRVSKGGRITESERPSSRIVRADGAHNRAKRYLLREDSAIPPLVDMGIFTKDGKIVNAMHHKFRQINRFLEMINDETGAIAPEVPLHIVDFGCGKSYLTFVVYHYLTYVRRLNVHMVGLDLKADVIEKCCRTASRYGYENLSFELGDIGAFAAGRPIDMVIALHACDTATDYALYHAVLRRARYIFSAPCCQHEVNTQINSDEFAALMRYGIVKERVSALMTDAIRANLLTACGYRTQLLEFIELDHTPKNLLIRARRGGVPLDKRRSALEEADRLARAFGFEQTLRRLIGDEIAHLCP